jgi:hypothetical protein
MSEQPEPSENTSPLPGERKDARTAWPDEEGPRQAKNCHDCSFE